MKKWKEFGYVQVFLQVEERSQNTPRMEDGDRGMAVNVSSTPRLKVVSKVSEIRDHGAPWLPRDFLIFAGLHENAICRIHIHASLIFPKLTVTIGNWCQVSWAKNALILPVPASCTEVAACYWEFIIPAWLARTTNYYPSNHFESGSILAVINVGGGEKETKKGKYSNDNISKCFISKSHICSSKQKQIQLI